METPWNLNFDLTQRVGSKFKGPKKGNTDTKWSVVGSNLLWRTPKWLPESIGPNTSEWACPLVALGMASGLDNLAVGSKEQFSLKNHNAVLYNSTKLALTEQLLVKLV